MPSVATEFSPFASLLGGAIVGVAAVMMMALHGRIAGISGIVSQAAGLSRHFSRTEWRVSASFVAGLFVAPLVWTLGSGIAPFQTVSADLPTMAIAGLLVGAGSAMGSGCTSGHGVCGLARLSPRSLASVATFMSAGVATVYLLRHVFAGAI